MRLDTIVFRLGLTPTIPSARQFVNHGHLLINGKRVNIPSFICEPGDQIQIQSKKSATDFVKNNLLSPRFSSLPNHLEFDSVNLTANIKNLVDRKDLIFRVNELLIVEYYSRIG
jgi:small subunit ribosomal protein S4